MTDDTRTPAPTGRPRLAPGERMADGLRVRMSAAERASVEARAAQGPAFQRIQQRLTRELEKKFSDHHVVFIGQRRIMGKPTSHSRATQPRPRSRTLTAVHSAILEDLVFPTEITAKRVRVSTDGSKLVRCALDSKDATSLEYKLETFSSVYRKLTGKEVAFTI